MSEPTFYELAGKDHVHWTDEAAADHCKHPGCEAVDAWVVPVERCEPPANFPTRDQARGLLILRGVQCDNNADARALIEAYIDGSLVWCPGAEIGDND